MFKRRGVGFEILMVRWKGVKGEGGKWLLDERAQAHSFTCGCGFMMNYSKLIWVQQGETEN